jgi:hypothetical protein
MQVTRHATLLELMNNNNNLVTLAVNRRTGL